MLSNSTRGFFLHFLLILLATVIPLFILYTLNSSAPPAYLDLAAANLSHQLDSLLQTRLRETFTIAAFPSLRAFASSDPASRPQRSAVALNELQAWVAADSEVREAFVVDGQAKVILTTGTDWNQDWSARAFIPAALSGKLDVSPVAHDVNEFSQYYSAPILDNGGSVVAALVARIAAQELWDAVNVASDPNAGTYAVVVDENGVRLADGGDATRIMAALAPLTPDEQTRIISGHTYGAQVNLVRATNLTRASELITSGALDSLRPGDFGVNGLAAQRLTTKPWTVLVLSTPSSLGQRLGRLWLPLLGAILGATLAALLLSR
jgi:hypothetical protein